MNRKTLPVVCPSCGRTLQVKRFECPGCKTAVEGSFDLPVLARLSEEEQAFVRSLIKYSGSLKELARLYDVSYPTVRNRLDALIEKVRELERTASENPPEEST